MVESNSELEELCTAATDNYDSDGTHECGLEPNHNGLPHKCFCGEEW